MDGWLGLESQRKILEDRPTDLTLRSFVFDLFVPLLIFFFLWVGAMVADLAFGVANHLVHFMLQRKPLFVTCALSLGIAMYKIKKEFPVLYGASGVGFGTACVVKGIYTWPTGTVSAELADPHLTNLIAVVSGVYVIARGMEDFRKRQRKDVISGAAA